jgi:hypothetical protein
VRERSRSCLWAQDADPQKGYDAVAGAARRSERWAHHPLSTSRGLAKPQPSVPLSSAFVRAIGLSVGKNAVFDLTSCPNTTNDVVRAFLG